MSVVPAPQPAARWPILRKKQVVVIPVITLVLGGLIQLFFVLTTLAHPVGAVVAVTLSGLSTLVGGALLLFLDRWEPEPPRLLAASFLWGGGIALVLALVGNLILAIIFGQPSDFVETVVLAPLTEESSKGMFLLLVLLASRRGRSEVNTMTDAIVYGGFIGLGFSFVEDQMYIAQAEDLLLVAGLRLTLGAWGHSIYTIATAVGVWFFLSRQGPGRWLSLVGGWAVAVALHALHNAATTLGLLYLPVALVLTGGGIVGITLLAVHSKRQEQAVVSRHLPLMVQQGLITAGQAGWLSTLQGRKQAFSRAGSDDRKRMRNYRDNLTELAFVRDRLDRMGPPYNQDLVAQHEDLVRLIAAERPWVSGVLPAPWAPPLPAPVGAPAPGLPNGAGVPNSAGAFQPGAPGQPAAPAYPPPVAVPGQQPQPAHPQPSPQQAGYPLQQPPLPGPPPAPGPVPAPSRLWPRPFRLTRRAVVSRPPDDR